MMNKNVLLGNADLYEFKEFIRIFFPSIYPFYAKQHSNFMDDLCFKHARIKCVLNVLCFIPYNNHEKIKKCSYKRLRENYNGYKM